MLAYCGRPSAAASGDPSSYIVPRYARVTIAGIYSLRVALATAIISQTGSVPRNPPSSRNNQARALSQSRCTVRSDMPSARAVSSSP